MNIVVLGAGMMGSAICIPLLDSGHTARLVGTPYDNEIIETLKRDQRHATLNYLFPKEIEVFYAEEIAHAMKDCKMVVFGVSSPGVFWGIEAIKPFLHESLLVCSITKGMHFDGKTLKPFPSIVQEQFLAAGLSNLFPAAIAGPCIAGELLRRVPTCVLLTGHDAKTLERIADCFKADYYHLIPCLDVIGVEVCAALKNAYAMGVAFPAGIHQKSGGSVGSLGMHNLEAALFAQSLREMQKIVTLLGGDANTVAGLAGSGDLDVTNNGGRTGRFGRLLGSGLTVAEARTEMKGATLECLEILAVFRSALGVYVDSGQIRYSDFPLLQHLIEVALEGKSVNIPFKFFSC